LRAEAKQLILSWRKSYAAAVSSASDAGTRLGGVGVADAELGVGPSSTEPLAAAGVDGERVEIVPVELVRHLVGSSRFYFHCPGSRSFCGRRVLKLYFVCQQSGFLCRRCAGLTYAGPYESSAMRAVRRASKLWRDLDSAAAAAVTSGAEAIPEPDYKRLIGEVLQAETQVTEIQVAQLQRLIAWLDNRRKFTL
jgi:hypothetical protein